MPDNSVIAALIDEKIHHERNRRLLKRRLIDGICFEPLAEEFDLSVRQTKILFLAEQNKFIKKRANNRSFSIDNADGE